MTIGIEVCIIICILKPKTKSLLFPCIRHVTMKRFSSPPAVDDRDDYPKVTQADLDRATFRVGLKPAPRKQRITISLDTSLVEYFKAKAGKRGYQTLINETLRQAKEQEELVRTLRRVIREELHHEKRYGST